MIKVKEKKKTHGIQLLLRAVVRDPDGKIVSDTGKNPARSFVTQFLEFIGALFDGLDTDATPLPPPYSDEPIYYTAYNFTQHLTIKGPVGDDDYGPVVGTGDTAAANTDYLLQAQLTHGAGAGNITHGATTVGTAGVAGANVDLEVERTFTNNTGSTIGVKEVGIYAQSVNHDFCIVRDVFPGTVNVPDKFSLTIYYTIRTTA